MAKATTEQLPVVEGLFTWPANKPHLIGSKCLCCGTYFFPKTFTCVNPDCKDKSRIEEVLLSRRGKLWSYCVEYYPPPPPFKAPEPFSPYAIGAIDLPEGLRILGMLTGIEPEKWRVGVEVEMVVEKMYLDEQGNEIVTWKFRPA